MSVDPAEPTPHTEYQIRTFESPTLSPTSIVHNGREYTLLKTDEKRYEWIDRITLIALTIFSVGMALIFKSVRQNWTMLLNNKKYEATYKSVDSKITLAQDAPSDGEKIKTLAQEFKEDDDSLSLESLKKACIDLSKKTLKLDGTVKTQALFLASIYSEIESRTKQSSQDLQLVVDEITKQIMQPGWKRPIESISNYFDKQIQKFLYKKAPKITLEQPPTIVMREMVLSFKREIQDASPDRLIEMIIHKYPSPSQVQRRKISIERDRSNKMEGLAAIISAEDRTIGEPSDCITKAREALQSEFKTGHPTYWEQDFEVYQQKIDIRDLYQTYITYFEGIEIYSKKHDIVNEDVLKKFRQSYAEIWVQVHAKMRADESMKEALHRLFESYYLASFN
ncbi:MAG: hypothetical protein QRY74_00555 [Chlamydia sp.]